MTLGEQLAALQVVVPLLSSALVFLLPNARLSWLAATLVSSMSFLIAVTLNLQVLETGVVSYAMGGLAAPYGIELRIDALSAILLLVVTGASTLALLAGRLSLSREIGEERLPPCWPPGCWHWPAWWAY